MRAERALRLAAAYLRPPVPTQTCGAELFTGNTAYLPAAIYEGKATVKQMLR